MPELLETIAHRNARQISARLLGVAVGDRRDVDPHDRQAAADRPRHPVAPGRGVLGAGPRLPRLRRVARPRRRRPRQRVHGVHPRLARRRHRPPSPPVRRPDGRARWSSTTSTSHARCPCPSGRAARRSTRSGRCTTRARTAPTGAVGPTPWRSSSPRSGSTPRRSTPGRRSDRTRDAPHTAPYIGPRGFRSAGGLRPGRRWAGWARRPVAVTARAAAALAQRAAASRSSPAARRAPRLPQ